MLFKMLVITTDYHVFEEDSSEDATSKAKHKETEINSRHHHGECTTVRAFSVPNNDHRLAPIFAKGTLRPSAFERILEGMLILRKYEDASCDSQSDVFCAMAKDISTEDQITLKALGWNQSEAGPDFWEHYT